MKKPNRLAIEEEPSIDLSPMIDCIFILLIFFIVTTVFVEESGLQVNKPDAASAANPNDNDDSIVFEINEENEVIFDAQTIAIQEVTSRVKSGVSEPSTPVVIRASEKSDHGTFVAVWDAARLGGAEVLSFNTVN